VVTGNPHNTDKEKHRNFNDASEQIGQEMNVEKTKHMLLSRHQNFFILFYLFSRKFTIYSTNGAISKYVVRKHLCGAIIQ
jgi:hypothetical protein